MCSGEWDLRALKALEEEEQKEFLALSQKSLFEPPSSLASGSQGSKSPQKGAATTPATSGSGLTYAQLHPHLLKLQLPTIDECNLQLARQQQQQQQQQKQNAAGGRLKFTRALSLSAHSLSGRLGGAVGAASKRAKSVKCLPLTAKSSGSLSLSPTRHSASPVYTPPPIRRCATLHHTQPVRKTFKTLQQLEKQKRERKQQQQLQQQQQTSGQSATYSKSAQLQRVAGTHKTYWKYGANSTAASIIGQRTNQLLQQRKRASLELESNTSDELGSEETTIRPHSIHAAASSTPLIDFDDSATDTGSCSVPLNSDSVEMMRLMLNAATSAVCVQPTSSATIPYLSASPDITSATATGGTNAVAGVGAGAGAYLTLSRYPNVKMSSPVDETVTYEAFHALSRRKSFSGQRQQHTVKTLLRGQSLAESEQSTSSTGLLTGSGNRKMLKSNSVDASTTIKPNSPVDGFKNATSNNSNSNNGKVTNNKNIKVKIKGTTTATTKATINGNGIRSSPASLLPTGMLSIDNTLHFNESQINDAASPSNGQEYGTNSPASAATAMVAVAGAAATASASAGHIIDDELEQHIKHCSCSCNHMGYGNSMDYQTTGFGGLPDVTEHSNIRRTLSRQNSISNSDSGGEIASIQKSKVNFVADSKTTTSTAPNNSASAKRKSKAAQQNERHGSQRYKNRRNTCLLTLTLFVSLALLAIATTLAYQHFLMAPSRNSHAQRLRIVRRILREVPLVDGHNNFAWNVRKYAHSSLELVHLGHEGDDHKTIWTRPVWAQTDMERLRQGLVGVQVWSAYVPCEAQGLDAVQLALEQIDIIRRLTDMYSQQTALVTTSQDIATAHRRGLMASLIGIEGGHTIGSSLGVLRSFYSLGARYLSLTHKCDVSWAGSSASPMENGLSQFGKAIIREMNRLGMMIDLSYSSDSTARDVLQATRAPVIFSHSAARQLCNTTRNIPDDILRLVAENGGLIMISFDSDDVACGRQARLSDVIAHINYIRTIAGVQHIGLGAGYDGIELPPVGLEDVSKYPDLLATLLEDHNWSEEDIAMLAGKNFLRIMETVENVRDYWKRAAIQPIEQTEPQPKTQCTYMSS